MKKISEKTQQAKWEKAKAKRKAERLLLTGKKKSVILKGKLKCKTPQKKCPEQQISGQNKRKLKDKEENVGR